jgi:hypothetical protein
MKKSVIIACVLLMLVSVLALVGCGGGSSSSSKTPEQVAKAFFTAYQNKDANTSWDLLSAASIKTAKKADWATHLKDSEDIKFSVGKVTVNGDKATAKVTATVKGESSTESVPLVKENGEWKVDMAAFAQQE